MSQLHCRLSHYSGRLSQHLAIECWTWQPCCHILVLARSLIFRTGQKRESGKQAWHTAETKYRVRTQQMELVFLLISTRAFFCMTYTHATVGLSCAYSAHWSQHVHLLKRVCLPEGHYTSKVHVWTSAACILPMKSLSCLSERDIKIRCKVKKWSKIWGF